MIEIRKYNKQGIESFRSILERCATDGAYALHARADVDLLLSDQSKTERICPGLMIDEAKTFESRFQLAEYLLPVLEKLPLGTRDPLWDEGLLAWLAGAWFDSFAPVRKSRRKMLAVSHWIPNIDTSRRWYRHVVLGPLFVVRQFRDRPELARMMLSPALSVPTAEIYRAFIENPRFFACVPAVEVAHLLYWDPATQSLKRGHGDKGTKGDLRGLLRVLNQLDRTFDLHFIPAASLLAKLPNEFDGFRPTNNA